MHSHLLAKERRASNQQVGKFPCPGPFASYLSAMWAWRLAGRLKPFPARHANERDCNDTDTSANATIAGAIHSSYVFMQGAQNSITFSPAYSSESVANMALCTNTWQRALVVCVKNHLHNRRASEQGIINPKSRVILKRLLVALFKLLLLYVFVQSALMVMLAM